MVTLFTMTQEALDRELQWLSRVISTRYALSYGNETAFGSVLDVPLPDLEKDSSFYAAFVRENELGFEERLMLILGLTPYLRPALLDPLQVKNPDTDKPFTEFGGYHGTLHNGFLPTGQTLLYLLAGDDLEERQRLMYLFREDHVFYFNDVMRLGGVPGEEPFLSGPLVVSADFSNMVLTGKRRKSRYTLEFPAKIAETGMTWDELVLDESVMESVKEIMSWLEFSDVLMKDWGMERKIKPGYRALFYGPPGTGKTLTATLLGKATGKEVYQIDLSMVVSKYIGETEKNLSKIFDAAQNKNWILFFDEADALFGKRTKVNDSHDRYANQEVSYLLQRVEEYSGLVILATNLKSNIDDAFLRRFQTVVNFPIPKPEERLTLWLNCFPPQVTLHPDISMRNIAAKHELSGGSIINIVQFCLLQTLRKGSTVILPGDLQEGIRREFRKEGKTV